MSRPKKPRCVASVPGVTYFKPRGIPLGLLEETILTVEELEAIRLKDLEDLDGEQAALRMNVSRPTFQRILEKARTKVAEALVHGKALKIEGGVYHVAKGRFRCPRCRHEWEAMLGACCRSGLTCPACQAVNVERLEEVRVAPGPPSRPDPES